MLSWSGFVFYWRLSIGRWFLVFRRRYRKFNRKRRFSCRSVLGKWSIEFIRSFIMWLGMSMSLVVFCERSVRKWKGSMRGGWIR